MPSPERLTIDGREIVCLTPDELADERGGHEPVAPIAAPQPTHAVPVEPGLTLPQPDGRPGPLDSALPEPYDEALVTASQKGDGTAFGQLYKNYHPKIWSFFYFRTRNTDLADDLTNQTFLQALEALPAYEKRDRFGAWLHRIAKNLCISHWRRQDSYTLPLEERFLPSMKDLVEDRVELALDLEHVHAGLRRLTIKQQRVIELRFLKERTVKETAEILGFTEVTVKALQRRAIETLKRNLQTSPAETPPREDHNLAKLLEQSPHVPDTIKQIPRLPRVLAQLPKRQKAVLRMLLDGHSIAYFKTTLPTKHRPSQVKAYIIIPLRQKLLVYSLPKTQQRRAQHVRRGAYYNWACRYALTDTVSELRRIRNQHPQEVSALLDKCSDTRKGVITLLLEGASIARAAQQEEIHENSARWYLRQFYELLGTCGVARPYFLPFPQELNTAQSQIRHNS